MQSNIPLSLMDWRPIAHDIDYAVSTLNVYDTGPRRCVGLYTNALQGSIK